MKKSIAFVLALMVGLILLAGCGGESGDVLKGTWKGEDSNTMENTLTFDGKGGIKFTSSFYDKEPGTYTITDDQVEIQIDVWDAIRTYTFVVDGDKLTLTTPEDKYYVGFELEKQ